MIAWRPRALVLASVLVLSGCGGAPPRSEIGTAASVGNVAVTGNVAERGTRGPILVFAYSDLAPNEDPATHEPASVGALSADGAFDVSVPPSASLTLVFLADGAHDGVVDQGDPIAVLNTPELSDLQAGDRVRVGDAAIDFRTHRITATVEVTRPGGEPALTPTPLP